MQKSMALFFYHLKFTTGEFIVPCKTSFECFDFLFEVGDVDVFVSNDAQLLLVLQ